jgi:hypothetical protein
MLVAVWAERIAKLKKFEGEQVYKGCSVAEAINGVFMQDQVESAGEKGDAWSRFPFAAILTAFDCHFVRSRGLDEVVVAQDVLTARKFAPPKRHLAWDFENSPPSSAQTRHREGLMARFG